MTPFAFSFVISGGLKKVLGGKKRTKGILTNSILIKIDIPQKAVFLCIDKRRFLLKGYFILLISFDNAALQFK